MRLFILFTTLYTQCFNSFGQDYFEEIRSNRVIHMAKLLDTSEHILTAQEANAFQGVAYFEIDTVFRVAAQFREKKGKWFEMPTTTARKPIYRKYGTIEFVLNKQTFQLTVYQNKALRTKAGFENYLFIPFKDATNEHETYGGGRYLDFTIPTSKTLIVDFNSAYNPYCAYASRYSCPIPPQENYLLVEIRAGEKVPVGYKH